MKYRGEVFTVVDKTKEPTADELRAKLAKLRAPDGDSKA